MAQAISIEQAVRRAVQARAHGASIQQAIDVATGKLDRRTRRAAERGAVKAAQQAASRYAPSVALLRGHSDVTPQQLEERLRRRLLDRYEAEIRRRGGETQIETTGSPAYLRVVERRFSLALLRADGWRYYSRRFGSRPASIVYLAGMDDSGPWAVRVPGTIETIADALEWVEPAQVRKARTADKTVLRQGDVYAVECRQDRALTDARALPASHRWDSETRTLHHLPDDGRVHAPLHVPFPARLVRQRVYEMGRGGRRGYGD